jgi:hypothetical protein
MQLLWAGLFVMLVLWPCQFAIGETEKVPRIIWNGELLSSFRLALIDGRYYFYGPDLISLVEAGRLHLEEDCKKQIPATLFWIPLRSFWEKLGGQVIWLPELETIVLREGKKEETMPEEAIQVLKEGIADSDWLQAHSAQELYEHLLGYYTPNLAEELLPDILDFIKEETDWHSLYLLQDMEFLDRAEEWLLLYVSLKEISPLGEQILLGSGVIKMVFTEEGFWKIGGIIYEWGAHMGFR